MDQLPDHIRQSTVFTGNELAKLAGVDALPDAAAIRGEWLRDLLRLGAGLKEPDDLDTELRVRASRAALLAVFRKILSGESTELLCAQLQRVSQAFLADGDLERAWACALMSEPEQIRLLTVS